MRGFATPMGALPPVASPPKNFWCRHCSLPIHQVTDSSQIHRVTDSCQPIHQVTDSLTNSSFKQLTSTKWLTDSLTNFSSSDWLINLSIKWLSAHSPIHPPGNWLTHQFIHQVTDSTYPPNDYFTHTPILQVTDSLTNPYTKWLRTHSPTFNQVTDSLTNSFIKSRASSDWFSNLSNNWLVHSPTHTPSEWSLTIFSSSDWLIKLSLSNSFIKWLNHSPIHPPGTDCTHQFIHQMSDLTHPPSDNLTH